MDKEKFPIIFWFTKEELQLLEAEAEEYRAVPGAEDSDIETVIKAAVSCHLIKLKEQKLADTSHN